MITIAESIKQAERDFNSITESPRLDAELLLAHVLKYTRTQLHTWPEQKIPHEAYLTFKLLCEERASGIPIAYLLGHQAFWRFDLKVTPDVLIPRPETELAVDAALELFSNDQKVKAVDLGTGSGAIALALAYERSHWDILAIDASDAALAVAKENAGNLHLNIQFKKSDWFSELTGQKFNLIISNPPYIAPNDIHLPALRYEPQHALVAEKKGLLDLETIILQAPNYLLEKGYLILEHGFDQADAVNKLMMQNGFIEIKTLTDLARNPRVTLGKKS